MAAVHARLAAVVEALVLAAVAELKKLVEARRVRAGAGEEPLLSDQLMADTWDTVVRKVQWWLFIVFSIKSFSV